MNVSRDLPFGQRSEEMLVGTPIAVGNPGAPTPPVGVYAPYYGPATAYGRHLRGADVIVGWRNRGYAPFRRPGAVGVGGNRFVTGYREADGTRVSRAVRGGVVLDAGRIGRLTNGFGRGYTWGEVLMHEKKLKEIVETACGQRMPRHRDQQKQGQPHRQ